MTAKKNQNKNNVHILHCHSDSIDTITNTQNGIGSKVVQIKCKSQKCSKNGWFQCWWRDDAPSKNNCRLHIRCYRSFHNTTFRRVENQNSTGKKETQTEDINGDDQENLLRGGPLRVLARALPWPSKALHSQPLVILQPLFVFP